MKRPRGPSRSTAKSSTLNFWMREPLAANQRRVWR